MEKWKAGLEQEPYSDMFCDDLIDNQHKNDPQLTQMQHLNRPCQLQRRHVISHVIARNDHYTTNNE